MVEERRVEINIMAHTQFITAPIEDAAAPSHMTGPQVDQVIDHDGQLDNELQSVTGEAWQDTIDRIGLDPTIAMIQELSLAPYVAASWSVTELEGAPEGAGSFVLAEMQRHKLKLLTAIVNGHMEWGWSPFEKIFKVKDQSWVIEEYKPLLQSMSTLVVDKQSGEIVGLKQDAFNNNQATEIDRAKLFYSGYNVRGQNWYGRPVYKTVEATANNYATTQAAACKYDAKVAGSHWLVKYPTGVSGWKGAKKVDNFTIAHEILAGLVASGGVVIPQTVRAEIDQLNDPNENKAQWDISILSDSGSTAAAFGDRSNYMDKLKVRAFGWPERAILEGQFGTKAEAETHGDFALFNVEIKHGRIVEEINKQDVDQLMWWNYGEASVGTVILTVSPLSDSRKAILKEIFMQIIGDPGGLAMNIDMFDMQQFRDILQIPTDPNATETIPDEEPEQEEDEEV
jgi:hypothetical protein